MFIFLCILTCIQVKGGSGDYVWSSSNVETTTVNTKGEITTGARGEAQITAADAKNRAHTGFAKVRCRV